MSHSSNYWTIVIDYAVLILMGREINIILQQVSLYMQSSNFDTFNMLNEIKNNVPMKPYDPGNGGIRKLNLVYESSNHRHTFLKKQVNIQSKKRPIKADGCSVEVHILLK